MNDFLDIVWKTQKLYIDKNILFSTSCDIASIILSVNSLNFNKFLALDSFNEILKTAGIQNNLYGIQSSQIGILNSIKKYKISKFDVIYNLQILNKENVISDLEFKNLIDFLSFLTPNEEQIKDDIKNKNFSFHKKIDLLNSIADELCEIDNDRLDEINKIKENAKNNEFVISVTGVINAGKSSMLNALIGEDILGTSNIPETANLTIMKYGEDKKAKISFYTKEEMQILGFEDKDYTNKEININELRDYTSAKNEISKFIKSIELGLNSEILKDNITIVDTPGLDDTVVLREELTKSFMNSSDVIIHLMNASQTSTKKDMTFIIDILKNSKNSSLIIVLTHADALGEKELNDALNYTKRSLNEELGNDEELSKIKDNISFFCIDSKTKRGILELESFIYESFFGQNSKKANLVLDSYRNALKVICNELLQKSKLLFSNLKSDKSLLQDENEKTILEINELKSKMKKLQDSLDEMISKLQYDFDLSSLKPLKFSVKDRIVSDLKYCQNRREKPNFSRLKAILQGGFDDKITDLIREFSQRISKDIDEMKSVLSKDFEDLDNFVFDTREFIKSNFNKPDYTIVNSKLLDCVLKNKADALKVSSSLDAIFSEFVNNLNLQDEFLKVSKACTDGFCKEITKIFQKDKDELMQKEAQLNNALKISQNDNEEISKKSEELEQNIRILSEISQRIEDAK